MVVRPKIMFFNIFKFHLQFWQMCKLFANKLYSINTYFYSPVWIMMVYNNFDSQNLLLLCLQISPQIFAILQNFAINNLRDQQFCTLLCELEWQVVVLFTGIALEVEVPPGMVWVSCAQDHRSMRRKSCYLMKTDHKCKSGWVSGDKFCSMPGDW